MTNRCFTHEPQNVAAHAGVHVTTCSDCDSVTFHDSQGYVSPEVGLGRLFGEFDLVGGLPSVGAPGREVLMYRAGDRLTAAALRVVDANRWFYADDGLWFSHDGLNLLFAHNDPSATTLVGA